MIPTLVAAGPGAPDRTPADGTWHLCLYVAGRTPKALMALENLRKICEEYLRGRYTITVIDLVASPQLAARDQIIAVPTLVVRWPSPVRRIIGDLSSTGKVLAGLGLGSVT